MIEEWFRAPEVNYNVGFEVCFNCAQCMSFYSENLDLRSLQLTLHWIMDDQQVALGARGHVEGTHASINAAMIVHKLKSCICPKFLHLGGSRGPH